jgi:hypothetical protein
MVTGGVAEETIVARIDAAPCRFAMDGEHLVQLKEGKVPAAVLRAMIRKNAATPPVSPVPAPGEPAITLTVHPIEAPAHVTVRQDGGRETMLADHPQKVLFVKSAATNAKEAIANLLLSDAGLNLITMALAPQMKMWNPYMNDSLRKAVNLGQGMLAGHGIDTKGFEYDTLPGNTAAATLREGGAEFIAPLNPYLASAEMDLSRMQPVLLRLEVREQDRSRMLASRQVLLKQNRTSRFDLKPTMERVENGVEQSIVPVETERLPGNVYRIKSKENLVAGEYALVFRNPSAAGGYTSNVALQPARNAASPGVGAFPAMPTPSASPFGMLRRGPSPGMQQPPVAPVAPGVCGFLAWDFRVVRSQ